MLHQIGDLLSECQFYKHFGKECPACGIQRAFFDLLNGNLMDSLHHNPALIPILFTMVLTLLQIIFKWRKGAWLILSFFSLSVLLMLIKFFTSIFF